nr:zinc knuckle CX2CX4HX4C [Tanacetum cinerariifolium]
METEEISDRYVAPCFVNGLEAYVSEINLGTEENMISNEFTMKLCLEHEVKRGHKVVKKDSGEEEKIGDDCELLLDDLDFRDIPNIKGVEVPPFVCKIGKNGKPLIQEEAEREALAIDICRRYSLLEEERPVIETMAYSDKYKKILDGICIDKMKLDGEIKKEEEEAITTIKGKTLIEKEDPGAFVIPIRLEEAWTNAFNIDEPIYSELFHEFYSTYKFDEVCTADELRTKKIIKFRLYGRAFSWTFLEFAKRSGLYNSEEIEEEGFDVYFQEPCFEGITQMITYGLCRRTTGYDKMQKNDLWLLIMFEARHQNRYANVAWLIARWMKRKGVGSQKESMIYCGQFITKIAKRKYLMFKEVLNSLSAPIYCKALDTTTLRELIDSKGRLIPEALKPGVPRVVIPRPPRVSTQDLYEKMGSIEIRQEEIERISYRQSYHWDRNWIELLHKFSNFRVVYESLVKLFLKLSRIVTESLLVSEFYFNIRKKFLTNSCEITNLCSCIRKVVQKVNSMYLNTLYGYFIGKRMAFPVVEYYAKTNWAKHGLKRIMMNAKGFFFFQFGMSQGLEDVLEGGPWMVCNSPIIIKKWTVKTSLLKEELTRIPVWIKFHDIPLQVFEEEGVSLIASYLGKPIMMDSITSSMCKDAWGRSSFARCLVEINSDSDFLDKISIGVPDIDGPGFTKETISVEYEWKPPRC